MKIRNLKTTAFFVCLLSAFMLFAVNPVEAQSRKKKAAAAKAEQAAKAAAAAKKPAPKKGGIQPYSKVITKEAKTDEGLFDVHTLDKKYFFEIPNDMLGRDMLMVTRIAKTAAGIGFGGGKTNTQMLRWERVQDKILLRIISTTITADDDLPISEAVNNSNLQPILAAYDIKALSKDSTGVVIDVSALLTGDVKPLGLPQRNRTQ